jgi:hypothetical protein
MGLSDFLKSKALSAQHGSVKVFFCGTQLLMGVSQIKRNLVGDVD